LLYGYNAGKSLYCEFKMPVSPASARFFTVIGVLLLLLAHFPLAYAAGQDDLDNSIVKVYVTSKAHTASAPWNSDNVAASGSGFLLDGQRILTNAHVVSDAVFIELQRDGNPKRYQATVEAVSHELDVAILKVKDASFFTHSVPLQLGELPEVHQEIMVYGYPVGGDSLSTTRGIVSRIEYLPYAHSGLSYETIQIDAAVNAGNSGGPAMVDGKVAGMVMQKEGGNGEENIGYIIPVTMLKRFFKDMEDGKYNGFPAFSVETEYLLSPTLRKKYKLGDDQSGVLLTRVCAGTSAEKVLKEGDVITGIDGKKVDDDGTAPLLPKKTINFLYYIDMHQVGDSVMLDIVRDGKPLTVELPLDEVDKTAYIYDQDMHYFIYGGFVFVGDELADSCLSREDYDNSKQKTRKDDVKIAQVLAAPSNLGFHDLSSMTIEKINGERFDTFEQFYKLLKKTTSPFVELEDDTGYEIAIDRRLAEQDNAKLLEQYGIQQAQSKDVDRWEAELAKAK
jgi:S1-C subfamily serine protease